MIKIRGVSHTSILKNNAALEEIIGEISGINSITEYNVGQLKRVVMYHVIRQHHKGTSRVFH